MYELKKLGVRHVEGKNYKKLKKHIGYKSASKTFLVLGFFKT